MLCANVSAICCTAGYLSFGPMAQCVVHALKGLACRARVTPASSPASHCKQCSALTSPSLHARGCASPSRACKGHRKQNIFQWVQNLGTPRYLCACAAENVHPLEGLACRKRVAPASSPAAPASRVRRSRRLRSTLAAAPGLLAHALVTKQ